jgi:hypothetical protein
VWEDAQYDSRFPRAGSSAKQARHPPGFGKAWEAALPEARQSASVLAALPRAAALYHQQTALGLDVLFEKGSEVLFFEGPRRHPAPLC